MDTFIHCMCLYIFVHENTEMRVRAGNLKCNLLLGLVLNVNIQQGIGGEGV